MPGSRARTLELPLVQWSGACFLLIFPGGHVFRTMKLVS